MKLASRNGRRDDLVVATKCFNASGPDINAKGSSRRHVTRAVEASLKRLQTDRVDILYLHDPQTYDEVISTYKAPIVGLMELGLVAAVLYHALNGIRVILIDFWAQGTRYQRVMLWIAARRQTIVDQGWGVGEWNRSDTGASPV